MTTISLSLTRTGQLRVLVIINIHTFSGILIIWVFIMYIYIYEIYGILRAKYSYREIIYYQSHIKHLLNHYVTKINDIEF